MNPVILAEPPVPCSTCMGCFACGACPGGILPSSIVAVGLEVIWYAY